MYTFPEYRRRGLASRLLELLLEDARQRGYTMARLHASADGRPLYEKFGFAESKGYMVMTL